MGLWCNPCHSRSRSWKIETSDLCSARGPCGCYVGSCLRTERKVRSFLSHIPFVLNSFSTQYFYWFLGNFTSCTLTRSFPSPPMSVPPPLWPHFPPNKTQKKTGSICVAHMLTGSWSNSQGPTPSELGPFPHTPSLEAISCGETPRILGIPITLLECSLQWLPVRVLPSCGWGGLGCVLLQESSMSPFELSVHSHLYHCKTNLPALTVSWSTDCGLPHVFLLRKTHWDAF